jgi:hypothetical protein
LMGFCSLIIIENINFFHEKKIEYFLSFFLGKCKRGGGSRLRTEAYP